MPQAKRVFQYNLNGNFIAEFESINLAAKITKCPFSGIRGCAEGKYSYSGGYIWRYFKVQYLHPELKHKYESMRNRFKSVRVTREDRTIDFESISEAAKFLDCHRSAISQAISSKYSIKSVKGWKVLELD